MKRYLLYIVLTVVLSTAGCTRGQWLDEIETKRDEQATVVPILLDAYDKGLWVTSVQVVERTDKYLHHSEYHHRYRLTLSDDTVVEIEIGHPSDDKFYEKRGEAYISEILVSDRTVVFRIWNSNEEWRQKYNHLVWEDGETVRFSLRIRNENTFYSHIYYTSTDGNIVIPYNADDFGSNSVGYEAIIVSNTYENGQGVITFDGNVVSIGDNAFRECSSLKSITIPESVTSIGDYAFWSCSSLTSITIPDGVTSIGDNAFRGCSSLTSITIPESVTSIEEGVFYNCSSLTSITIPEGVTSIGNDAFRGCSSLAEVYCKATTPPTAVPSYDSTYWRAFNGNASGRKIYVPAESVEAYKTAEWWSDYANAFIPYDFEKGEVVNLESRKIYYTSTDGNVVTPYLSGTSCFGANIVSNTYENGKGVITFDGEVTKIGGQAFYDCSSLASITIPDGVTSIGDSAFRDCSSLTEFSGKFASEDGRCLIIDGVLNSFATGCDWTEYTIPEGVTSIGESAFYNCKSLASVTIPDSVTSIGNYAFYACSSLTSITIPDGVTSIGEWAFCDCSSLTSITIPDSVTSIGDYVFRECSNLASVTIPDSVTSIGVYAFAYCSSLASITIPDSVTSIGVYAFGITKLTSVTLPESLTSLGYVAFATCYSLKEVYCKAITPPTAIPDSSYGWDAFDYNASGRKIYVPEESVEAYKTAEWWSDYADDFVAYDFEKGEVVNLENRKIYYTSTDGNVVTPYYSGTSYFGANIVSNTYADGQGVITFDGNVTKIGNYAFRDCSSLVSITIPDGVTSIGYRAFYNCSSLASVTIGNGVTSIGNCAFESCSSLTSITIPDSVTSIGNAAFHNCTSLASITIPDSVTSIENSAFKGCSSLAGITIPEGVTEIGSQTFQGCSSLASITIPDSVTEIGDAAFYHCTSLTSITIPDRVTSIGSYAFYACSSLTSVYCKATTPPTAVPSTSSSPYWRAFDDNASGRKIYVPEESVEAYKSAEWWSEYADAIEPYVFE